MRLINTASYELESFYDETRRPPYAILSHTWGMEEVNLQQFQDAHRIGADPRISISIKEMAGNKKIMEACEQARKDAYEYIWVDTCKKWTSSKHNTEATDKFMLGCIDKTSSAELSEAINSMFKWYKRSSVCYAYLEDLSPSLEPGALMMTKPSMGYQTAVSHLSGARWFSRGWTLQELLAPCKVQFFTKKWLYIGNKESLNRHLCDITGIDARALQGVELEDFTVATRMSWAANRITTRVEDMAYSLLGMFNVNMALLYGEGDRAFVRLQEEVLRNSEDQTLFAWGTTESLRPASLTYVDSTNYMDGVSVFAPHPRNFAHTVNFYPMTPQGEPPMLSSRGVRLDLPIFSLQKLVGSKLKLETGQNLFLAILSCGYQSYNRRHPAIVVQRKYEDSNSHTYVRHRFAPLISISYDDIVHFDIRQIHLRKNTNKISKRLEYEVSPLNRPEIQNKFVEARSYKPFQSGKFDDQLMEFLGALASAHTLKRLNR